MPPSNPQSTGCIPIAGPSYGTQPTFDLSALTSPSAAAVPDYLGPSPFRPRFSQARRAGESPCALAARRGSASASPPSGLAVPPRNFALEPNAVCTFGQTMVQSHGLGFFLAPDPKDLWIVSGQTMFQKRPNDGSSHKSFRFPQKKRSLAWGAGTTCSMVPRGKAGRKRRRKCMYLYVKWNSFGLGSLRQRFSH